MVFGQLVEVTGASVFAIDVIGDTEMLQLALFKAYPLLKEKNFRIALNQKIISQKTTIGEQDTIALLPPFSGG